MNVTQNSFTKGELDPTLLARYDVDTYGKGARRLRNIVSLWTGSATKAPGLSYIDVIMDRTATPPAPVTNPAYVNGVQFEYDAENRIEYTIILRPDTVSAVAIDVYYNGALVASVAASVYVVADIAEITFAVGQDRILMLNENKQPQQLINNGTAGSWTFSPFVISTYPVFDYTTIGGTQYRVAGFTFTPGAVTGSTTLTASSAIYTANHVGGLFVGGGGIARITAVASSTSCTVTVLTDFSSTAAIPGLTASLNEVMWTSGGGSPAGANRGWPSRAIYYTNRLVLGRSLLINNVCAWSVVGVYDNFDDSDNDATAGFTYTINYKGNEAIEDFSGDDAFIMFGATRMYATNPLTENSVNVTDFYAPPQGGEGSSYVPSVNLDNTIYHTSPDRTQIVRVFYDTYKAKINSLPATRLSTQLVEVVTSMGAWLPPNKAAKLLFASQQNGSMLMLSTLEDDLVNAWSLRTTRGNFIQVMGLKSSCQSIVQRQVNLGSAYSDTPEQIYNTGVAMKGFQDISSLLPEAVLTIDDGYLLIGHEMPYTGLEFTFGTAASTNLGLTFQYLDTNGNWNTFSPTDGTSGMTATGAVTWSFTDVSDWWPNDIFDSQNVIEQKYWIRIRRTTETVVTDPIINTLKMNLGSRLFLEQFSFDNFMDCQKSVTANSSSQVTGVTNLAGEQVFAIWNKTTYGPYFVSSTGTVTVDEALASQTFVLGFQYKPTLIPMPIFTPTAEGDNLYAERYIEEMYIDYYESLYITAAMKDVPVLNVNQYTLDSHVQPQSGFFRINPMESWEPRQEIVISQSIPGPMTIRAIGYKVRL